MSPELFSLEEACDERVQKSSVRCYSDSKERGMQQFDEQKGIGESKSRRVDETKSPRLHLLKESYIVELPQMCEAYSIQGRTTPL